MTDHTTSQEKIDTLREAQEKLFEAIELIKQAVGDDHYVERYLIAPLEIAASSDSIWMSRDLNLDKVIENLENADDDEGWSDGSSGQADDEDDEDEGWSDRSSR